MWLSRIKHSLIIQLLEPTWGSSLSALAFALAMLLIGRLPKLSHQLNALYIPQAIDHLRHEIGHDIIRLLTFSLHGYANNFFLILFWVAIGIIIYFLLHGLGNIFIDLEENLVERNFLWPTGADRNQHLAIFITKTGFRIAILILLCIYAFALVPKVLHGLNVSLNRSSAGNEVVLHSFYFLIISWLLAHVFVVFLRLITLRTRLFYLA